MGRSSSKLLATPNNPLEELQFKEKQREQRKRKERKEQRQIAKLQKKHAKKNKNKKKNSKCSLERNSVIKHKSGAQLAESFDSQNICDELNNDELNRQLENTLQMHLNNDLSTFIMNQTAFGLQCFGNFESEMAGISDELLTKENELNQNLEEHSILLGNPIDVAVAKWIKYKPTHGVDKNNIQLLQPQAIYIVFENIDIARPNDANYDSISPLCKVDMDTDFYKSTPCKEDYVEMLREIKWKGYIRLKLREDPKVQRTACNDKDEVYIDGSSSYSNISAFSIKTPSTASSGYASESDYDYAYISYLNSHHPLSELKIINPSRNLDSKVMPESCVSSLANFIEPCHEEDTDDEHDDESDEFSDDAEYDSSVRCESRVEENKDYETIQAIRLYKIEQEHRKMLLQQNYLNSKEFMRYFGDVLRQKLARQLSITENDLSDGTYRGSSIYTKQYEIIPAIHVAQNAQHWPDCAFQFRIRERPISINARTGQKFQWPTRSMIKRIETFGFHVIPMGYAPKKQRNPFRELEWRIIFPKAERYLEQHLTPAQVKIFIMTKALVKTFVEPQEKNKALMFAIDHLRMHLFWECESNFAAWPEEFLGDVLVRFISSFMRRLREKCLRDYFIEDRNLLETIPEYSLVTLYSILADIVANPLMHLMVALRNLSFDENFFPKLNFIKIFENLVENDIQKLKMQAKNARSLIGVDNTNEEPALMMTDEGAKGLVGIKQHREKTHGKLRRKTHLLRHNIEVKKKQDYELRRISVESIDVEFFFTKNLNNTQAKLINQGVENLRRTNILEIFIDHMLSMTKKAVDLHTTYLAKRYLTHARRLCMLYHNYGCDMGAKEYLKSMHDIDAEVNVSQSCNEEDISIPPALPMRTSVEPVNSNHIKDLINLTNSSKTCHHDEPDRALDSPKNQHKLQANINENHIGRCEEEIFNKTSEHQMEHIVARKSIKFIEHVVEVHEGDANPIQKADGYTPVSILRFGGVVQYPEDSTTDIDLDNESINDNNHSALENKSTHEATESVSSTSILSKFATASGILKMKPSCNVMGVIASSTEKAIATMSTEERRVQIREMLKRKTVQLKGAFNQSSET